jgi:hypothetical protein
LPPGRSSELTGLKLVKQITENANEFLEKNRLRREADGTVCGDEIVNSDWQQLYHYRTDPLRNFASIMSHPVNISPYFNQRKK